MAFWGWFIYLFSIKACSGIYSFRPSWDAGGGFSVVLGTIIMMWWDDVMNSIPCWLFFFQEYRYLGCNFGLWFCSVLCRYTEEKTACTDVSDPFITEAAFGTKGQNEGLQPEHSSTTPWRLASDFDTEAEILEKSWYCLLIYRKGKKRPCSVPADTMIQAFCF